MPVERFTDSKGQEHARKPPGSSSKFTEDRAVLEKQRQALELYRQGHTYPEIAERLDIGGKQPRRTAQRYVEKGMARWPGAQSDADAIRASERARLTGVLDKAAAMYVDPGPAFGSRGVPVTVDGQVVLNRQVQASALRIMISASESLRKLYGADIPVEHKASLRILDDTDRDIAAYLATLKAAGEADYIVTSLIESFAETTPRALTPAGGWTPERPAGDQGEADGENR